MHIKRKNTIFITLFAILTIFLNNNFNLVLAKVPINNLNENYESNDIFEKDLINLIKSTSSIYDNKYKIEIKTDEQLLEEFYKERKLIENEMFEDYFEKVEWIDRSGEISLSIQPTKLLFKSNNLNPITFSARIERSFNLLKEVFVSDPKWNNTDSLYAQYKCHVIFAGSLKLPWNIEPFRTETDFDKVVIAGCNP